MLEDAASAMATDAIPSEAHGGPHTYAAAMITYLTHLVSAPDAWVRHQPHILHWAYPYFVRVLRSLLRTECISLTFAVVTIASLNSSGRSRSHRDSSRRSLPPLHNMLPPSPRESLSHGYGGR